MTRTSVSDYGLLYVQLDQGVLALQLTTSTEVDQQAVLEQLGGVIVPRAGTLPAPPPPPTRGTRAHAGTRARSIVPLNHRGPAAHHVVQAGSAIFSSDNEATAAFLAALTANGKTMDDVSVATG